MIVSASLNDMIPTQAWISWENLERIRIGFDMSKYIPPAVVRYDCGKYLIFNGHHRMFNNYRENLLEFPVNLIDDDKSLAAESEERIIKFRSIDSFVNYYTTCLKEMFERRQLLSVPDFERYII